MSSKEQTATAEKIPNVLVIELINQQPSNFVLDGAGEESDLPTNISAPNARKIKNRSKVKYVPTDGPDKGMNKLREIRYINGCDLIFVDEQVKAGYVPNPANDTIWILNGKLTVIESGSDIGKYRFLKAHEGNVSNMNRPENAIGIFEEIDTAVEAVELESIFDDELKVGKYLDSLKRKKGNNEYEYNEDAIAFLCKLFKLPPYNTGFKSEAWVALVMKAKENPKRFLTSIASLVAVIESEVNEAMSTGVIGTDEEKAFFVDGNFVISSFGKEMTSEEKKDHLVDFFTNPANRNYYDKLRTGLHNKKTQSAAVLT